MAKLNLDTESFDRVRELLLSPDEGNALMALQLLQNIDFRGSLGHILYLYKICPRDQAFWRAHAGNLVQAFNSIGVNIEKPLSYNGIMKVMAKQKIALDQFQFILEMYGHAMKEQLHQWGYSEVGSVQVQIKTN